MGKKVEKKANNVFFLTGEWTAFRRFVRQEVAFPEGMPSVYLSWLRYKEQGYDVHIFMMGRFRKYRHRLVDFQGCTIHLVTKPIICRLLARVLGRRLGLGGFIWLVCDNICLYGRAVRVARRLPPTIVYSLRPLNAFAARLLSKRYHCLCIRRIYGTLLHHGLYNSKSVLGKLSRIPEKLSWLCPADMTIITNDGTHGDKVADLLRIKKEHYRFWFNGIDKTWRPNGQEAKNLRKDIGLSANHFVLLCLSRLKQWKRQDRVIRAMKLIVKELPNARLVLAGDGPSRSYLTSLVAELGLTPFVKFLGMVPHNEVQKIMGIADVFLQTNDYSCLGSSLLEAIACGRTIVTWDVGGTSQVIHDEDTGCLLPNPEPSTIAEAVVDLAKNPEKAKRLGHNARIFAEQKLQSWDERLDMEINLVEELCSRQQQDGLSITPVHGLQKKR